MDILTLLLMALLVASPVLWLLSLLWLRKWPYIRPFFALNLVVLLGYLFVLTSPIGHDEYGLGRIFLPLLAGFTHVLLGFIFALSYRLRNHAS